jgi:hypothetical protein
MDAIARLLLFAVSELRPAERLSAGASRITTAAVLSAAAAVVLTIALACLVAAGWIALIPVVGPALAALCSAFALLVVASALWLLARLRIGRESEPNTHKGRHGSPLDGLGALLGDAGLDDVKRLWADHKIPILLAALIVGMTMGGHTREPD